MEEVIQIKNKRFVIEKEIASHEDHTTYSAVWSKRPYLIRVYNDKENYAKSLADYRTLKHAGINMAKMCFHDDASFVIVYDLFPENDCLTDLSQGELSDLHFQSLFALYRFARFSKVALDWEPQNFMLRGTQMFYLPTKWSPLTEKNLFEKSEAYRTWFLGKEGRALLKKKGYSIDQLPSLSEGEVNKALTLMAVRFW